MLAKIIDFVKVHSSDILLFLIIVLLVRLAFAAGFVTAREQFKEPIRIQQNK